jgi:hypothetical protein
VASLIGSLMVQREYNNVPVQLISLGMDEREVREYILDPQCNASLHACNAHALTRLSHFSCSRNLS